MIYSIWNLRCLFFHIISDKTQTRLVNLVKGKRTTLRNWALRGWGSITRNVLYPCFSFTSSLLSPKYLSYPLGSYFHTQFKKEWLFPLKKLEFENRQITGRIASAHFAPTALSRQNLLAEGIPDDKIHVVGNTVIDALHIVLKQVKEDCMIMNGVNSALRRAGLDDSLLSAWNERRRPLVLITGHRRENFGVGFTNICMAIRHLAEKYPFVDFVYPMHLNPNVRKPIMEIFGADHSLLYPNVYLIEPLDYLPFVYLMDHSYLVLTDSGGIQEEAPGLGKPVLVMRDTTERPEAVEAGTVKLVGTDFDCIVNNVTELLENERVYGQMAKALNPYGDGKTSVRIVDIILKV